MVLVQGRECTRLLLLIIIIIICTSSLLIPWWISSVVRLHRHRRHLRRSVPAQTFYISPESVKKCREENEDFRSTIETRQWQRDVVLREHESFYYWRNGDAHESCWYIRVFVRCPNAFACWWFQLITMPARMMVMIVVISMVLMMTAHYQRLIFMESFLNIVDCVLGESSHIVY